MANRTRGILLALVAGVAIGLAVGPSFWEWFAMDVCLDREGCWDRVTQRCNYLKPANCSR